jgi:phosphoribosylamine-glycine ligase
VYIYFITDGYNALPLIALERCEDENSIKTTAISQKITKKTLLNVLRNVVYPLLDDISKYSDCYTGILGIKVKINKDIYQVLEFYNGFQKYDFQAFLSLLDDDLLKLLIDAENGTLNENHTHVELSDYYSYSIAVDKGLIERLEHDFSESEDEKNLILTSIAPTINRAKEKLFNYFSLNCDKKIVDIEQLSEV